MISNCRLNTSPKLRTYTSVLSSSCSSSTLCLFSSMASSLDAFRSYPLERSCSARLVRRPIDQRLRPTVPLVLNGPYFQTIDTSSRYNPNCLTHVFQIFRNGVDYTFILFLQKGDWRISLVLKQDSQLSLQSLQG